MGTIIDIIESDEGLVLAGGAGRVERRHLGHLRIVSGQLAACDPRVSARDVVPFAQPVPSGTYSVDVALLTRGTSGEKRVALARVKLSENVPVRWVNAVPLRTTPAEPGSDDEHRYDVDAGIGCFADVHALRAFDECGDDATDEAMASMQQNDEQAWTWADVRCGDDGENVIMFSSGDGDGSYASFWGLDEAGTPVCLITDFGLLDIAWRDDAAANLSS